ncbi:MAG TPA: hypothetical protein VKH45_04960 [Candidatus Acidoferrum sp.]|nr:hypothetical protein [Candidatus Acidoferrum sp.]
MSLIAQREYILFFSGTTVRGAYDVLVSMGIITYFIPYLYLFAAMFCLQKEKNGPEVIKDRRSRFL